MAQWILAGCGICWAVAMWVPFAIIGMEMRRNLPAANSQVVAAADSPVSIEDDAASSSSSDDQYVDAPASLEAGDAHSGDHHNFSSGLLLGIHNVYVVMPQFVTSLIAAGVFALLAPSAPSDDGHMPGEHVPIGDHDSVGWVLRIGGVSAIIAGVLTKTRL